jgi:hypothetical protein
MTKHNFSYANDFCDKAFPTESNPFQNKLDAIFYALIGGEVPDYLLYPTSLGRMNLEMIAYISDEVLVIE